MSIIFAYLDFFSTFAVAKVFTMESDSIKLFESKLIRTAWDEEQEKWYFSIVDVVAALTDSADATAYWRKLKQRLKEEGNETVTNCHALKMTAADGKQRLTDVADSEQLLRLIQSIPSKKAEPFKLWLARVGSERPDQAAAHFTLPAGGCKYLL